MNFMWNPRPNKKVKPKCAPKKPCQFLNQICRLDDQEMGGKVSW